MPKAEILLPGGAKITVEGTEEEVRALVDLYAVRNVPGTSPSPAGSPSSRGMRPLRRPATGPLGYIRELKSEGFFDTKRSLKQIKDRLAEKGHIYPATSLSPSLIRLTRNRELGRLREKDSWVYVKR